ncbi:MAG: hypothetical protein IJ978_05675 [Clostridia bacterium]|nr:hypothetical protein [Clostridia bacterium]MBR2919421.1 hypothetical protein [Clostridia bacterium]
MEIEKFVVVLSSKTGGKNHLKISVNRGNERAEIHLGKGVKRENAVLYLFGDKITKQALYREKLDYKLRFNAKSTVDVLVDDGGEIYVGSTGKTPDEKALFDRIKRWEESVKNEGEISMKSARVEEEKSAENCTSKTDKKRGDDEGVFVSKGSESEDISDGAERQKTRVDEPTNKVVDEGVEGAKNPSITAQKVGGENDENATETRGEKGRTMAENEGGEVGAFSLDTVRFDGTNFYLSVKPQLDEIFVCFPECDDLEEVVPNSKWAKIQVEDGFYVVGLILDGEVVRYISYGVPATKNSCPPSEIRDVAVWLDDGKKEGKGYWVIYQDAMTGQCLK